jgi:hypothetical protein
VTVVEAWFGAGKKGKRRHHAKDPERAHYVINPGQVGSAGSLFDDLELALRLESSVIPVYLFAYYSLRNPCSAPARVLRSVVVEEMLHYTLVRNLLVAVGAPDERHTGVPAGPFPIRITQAPAPVIEIDLQPFSDTFLSRTAIPFELSRHPDTTMTTLAAGGPLGSLRLPPGEEPDPAWLQGVSLVDLYRRINDGLTDLATRYPEGLFARNRPELQLVEGYRLVEGSSWSSGHPVRITDLASARVALEYIVRQGEGLPVGHAGDPNQETPSHAQRFVDLYFRQEPWSEDDVLPLTTVPEEGGDEQGLAQVLDQLFNRCYRYLFAIFDQRYAIGPSTDTAWREPDVDKDNTTSNEIIWSGAHALMVHILPVIARRMTRLAPPMGPSFRVDTSVMVRARPKEALLNAFDRSIEAWPRGPIEGSSEGERLRLAISNLPHVYVRTGLGER